MKKMKKYLSRLFCSHFWFYETPLDTQNFINKCEKEIREGKKVMYFYTVDGTCTKCGKKVLFGSDLML